jgi:acyl-lipid omega-6 desaturase (Delta-12 desaturase)
LLKVTCVTIRYSKESLVVNEREPWNRRLAEYRPDDWRSLAELTVTIFPFIVLWTVMSIVSQQSYWVCLIIAIPAAGFLVRLFMIQHDCGHGSMFSHRAANDWIGRCLAVLTLTPYDYWRQSHAHHHASSSNLDRRGIGDITTLTVKEFLDLDRWGRLKYRLYRHPLVMFGFGPMYLFVFRNRFPNEPASARDWLSTMATNVAIAVLVTLMVMWLGWRHFLAIHGPITLIAASIGVWLFYVQHQFEDTLWVKKSDWSHEDAALRGSSNYLLPQPLAWFTANIGLHHIHHLSSRIPFYRLPDVLRRWRELDEVTSLTLPESLRCVNLALWDEESRKLVPFRAIRTKLERGQLLGRT